MLNHSTHTAEGGQKPRTVLNSSVFFCERGKRPVKTQHIFTPFWPSGQLAALWRYFHHLCEVKFVAVGSECEAPRSSTSACGWGLSGCWCRNLCFLLQVESLRARGAGTEPSLQWDSSSPTTTPPSGCTDHCHTALDKKWLVSLGGRRERCRNTHR